MTFYGFIYEKIKYMATQFSQIVKMQNYNKIDK